MRSQGALLGLAAGLISGLFGVGGGLVVVPGLILWLRFDQDRASATSLVTIVASASAAYARFAIDGSVKLELAALLLVEAAIGVALGSRLVGRVPNHWLARSFVGIALVSAVRLIASSSDAGTSDGFVTGGWEAAFLITAGLIAGGLAATLGIGGGLVFVPALVSFSGLEQVVAEGTSVAVIVPTALLGAALHARAGRVDWEVGLAAAITGVVGALIGAQVALDLSATTLQRLFAALLILVATRMLARTWATS